VTISDAIEVHVIEMAGSSCGMNNGIAEVSASGGVEPYSFVWSDGNTLAVDSLMAPGLYFVNVIDANDCYAQGSVVIGNDGTGPEINLEGTVDNICFGDMKGAIDISITGGELPYDILWSDGSTTEDLVNMEAGIYDIVVTDSDSCSTTGSFIIQEPAKITIGSVTEEASCLKDDGRAAVMVSGGTEPYLYSWSNGGFHPVEKNLSAGIYSVTITDDNGCDAAKSVVVNSIDGPVSTLYSISGVTCIDTSSGFIAVSTSGGKPLYTWLWSPGGYTTPTIDSLPVGVYEVKVTDSEGCTGFNYFEIKQDPPAVNPICLVTVDTVSGKNMVVWERLDPDNTDYYVIYRESSLKGEYVAIGTRPLDLPGIFIDSVADPTLRSWKYKLSVVDSCGNESELSETHKTMHLTMNIGLDENINLIWDHYVGFDVTTYEIWISKISYLVCTSI